MRKLLLPFILVSFSIVVAAQEKMPTSLFKLLTAGNVIERFYVDEIDSDKIVEEGIKAMLEKLDPHSTYTNAEETKALLEEMAGSFGGIGIQYNMLDDTLYVIQTTKAGPSERAGLLAGDRVITVNDTAISGVKMERADIMSRLRGPEGTKVKLGVKRAGVEDLIFFKIERGNISTESVDAAYMVDKKVGYIHISSFGATTYQEFVTALDSLKKCGMKSLMLDLQGNGGGYLSAAVDIANEFLEKGSLIVYTDGRLSPRYDHIAKGGGRFTKGNLVVLVDETSASASEILSGAIQDWDRGVIVGRRTFGKGLVQRPFTLPDNSMIRLTISRYYTPTGRSIQKPYGDSIKYKDDLLNRYNSGELTNADSIHFPDSLKTYTKRLGRVVYGGGGIMPDYFVPLDTMRYTKYHRELARKGSIIQVALRYVDRNRYKILEKYPSADEFAADFTVGDEIVELLRKQSERDSVKVEVEDEFAKSLPELTKQLRLLVARDIWGLRYMRMLNNDNDIYNKGYAIIKEKDIDAVLKKEKRK